MILPRVAGVFVPLLGAAVVVVMFLILSDLLHIDISAERMVSDLSAKKERAKLLWGVSALCLACALIWNVVTAGFIIRSSLAQYPKKVTVVCLYVLAAINAIGWACLFHFQVGGGEANYLIDLIQKKAGVPIQELTLAGNLLAFTAISALVASACCLAAPVEKIEVQAVSKKIKLCVFSLYSAAALLSVGLFEIYALFKWGAIVSGAEEETARSIVADALAVSAGIVFTVLLIAIYAPVAIIQHQWLDLVIEEESTRTVDLDVSKWLAKHGLKSSPLSIGSAMLSPLITGALTNVSKLFA